MAESNIHTHVILLELKTTKTRLRIYTGEIICYDSYIISESNRMSGISANVTQLASREVNAHASLLV